MDVDLKLLMILDEVYKTGSVSRAAANIGITQPSISIALAKLRNIFNDPLFGRGMVGPRLRPVLVRCFRLRATGPSPSAPGGRRS
jgi:DNA-binding transcriptional LysR family regulator